MPRTLQELSDRIDIEELLINYCDAIDNGTIDDFDVIFNQDAEIDYSNFGGPCGDVFTIKLFLKENLGELPKQHMMTNLKIHISGDTATARCLCFNPQGLPTPDGNYQMAFFGLWYEDTLQRTAQGWKINHRRSMPSYNYNIPAQ